MGSSEIDLGDLQPLLYEVVTVDAGGSLSTDSAILVIALLNPDLDREKLSHLVLRLLRIWGDKGIVEVGEDRTIHILNQEELRSEVTGVSEL